MQLLSPALCVFLLYIANVRSAKILGFFGHPGKSHFDVFLPLMEELAHRGHEITVVSFFPQKKPVANYTDISLEGLMPIFLNIVEFKEFEEYEGYEFLHPYLNFYAVYAMGIEACARVLPSKQVQEDLLQSGQKYDLIITELFNTDCFLGIIHKLQAPYIALSSCTFLPWFNTRFGNPSNPSYVPNIFNGNSDRMPLSQRVYNTFLDILVNSLYYPMFEVPAQRLVAQHIGKDVPTLSEIAKNTSMLMINTHFSVHRPKPLVPGIIEVGGMHIRPLKPLPEDMERFINESEHGVVLFSLGSMLKADTLGEAKRNAFIEAFKEMKQRVIWKFETDLPGLPENVRVYPWLPQRDILEHPNVRGFLAHGGLLGLTEAIYCGKPLLGIPMYGDQHANIRMAKLAGFAAELPFNRISKATVLEGLQTILSDEYYEKAQFISKLYRDRPIQPLQTAIYWIEYALKYQGARHLQSSAVQLNFIQYYLLDVGLVLILIASTILFLLYKVSKVVTNLFRKIKTIQKEKIK